MTTPTNTAVTYDEYTSWISATGRGTITPYTRNQFANLSNLHLHMVTRAVRNWQSEN